MVNLNRPVKYLFKKKEKKDTWKICPIISEQVSWYLIKFLSQGVTCTVFFVSIIIVLGDTTKKIYTFPCCFTTLSFYNNDNKNTYCQQIHKEENALFFKKIILCDVTSNDTGP